jgi:hypothetical protein
MNNPKSTLSITEKKYPIFRLWEAASFEPMVSWTIFVDEPNEHHNPMVRRVNGTKFTAFTGYDIHRQVEEEASYEKVICIDDYHLKPVEFKTLNLSRHFSLQAVNQDRWTHLDGIDYGLQVFGFGATLLLEWGMDGPEGWHDLTTWAMQTMEYLSSLIDKYSEELKDINQTFPPDHKIWRRLG